MIVSVRARKQRRNLLMTEKAVVDPLQVADAHIHVLAEHGAVALLQQPRHLPTPTPRRQHAPPDTAGLALWTWRKAERMSRKLGMSLLGSAET